MREAKRDTFLALCELASKEDWCWKIPCTTCGSGYFIPRLIFFHLCRDKGGHMLGSQGFTAVLSAIWTVILTAFSVVIATILFIFGGWKLAEIIWRKVKQRYSPKHA